jgi:murein DD-endopeptidase MepM/ murein hydrolase activator NlpD
MYKKIRFFSKYLCVLLLMVLTIGCVHRKPVKLPPVTEGWSQPAAGKNAYIVQKNDTLYSIAWAFDVDYRALAKRNNLKPPYFLRLGQRLYIVSSKITKLAKSSSVVRSNAKVPPIKGWSWPAKGTIVARYSNNLGGNRGIDIKGNYGDPVLASNPGKVVYGGSGIRSYGKLIIIKHNDDYLSAYAHNKSILVREGQAVKAGQKIATMGRDDAGSVRLHFEIRKVGKPVNPLLYLPKQS